MKLLSCLLVVVFLLSACQPVMVETPPEALPTATVELPVPRVHITRAPDVRTAVEAFLAAWKDEDFQAMYDMLSTSSRAAMTAADFIARYKDITLNLTLKSIEYEVINVGANPGEARAAYRVDFDTNLVGLLSRDMEMTLVMEGAGWKVEWEDGMIMPELRGGNHLVMDINTPARGNIYDREGDVLVGQADAFALGIIPAEIGEGQEGTLLAELARLTDKTPQSIQALYENMRGATWYVPVGDAPADEVMARYEVLSGLTGLRMNPFSSRYYFGGGGAAHVTGFALPIPAEEAESYQRSGYRINERIGVQGLEKWGQSYLLGTRGASLYVTSPNGEILARLSQTEPRPSHSIYTTIDDDFQTNVQRSLAGFRGAIVVLERDTGRVLAMASSPSFDSNLFDFSNFNAQFTGTMIDTANNPYLNRASQSAYPLGSVFKIITMAAALESDMFLPDTTYDCQHIFTDPDLPGQSFRDWTLEKELPPSGILTLSEGLMRSCNPWFYHIGVELYRNNRPTDVSQIARGFGLGEPTGIDHVAEVSGSMPNPVSIDDALQLSIGQGAMLATPLQTAAFTAAVGNGGTLYRPQIVEQVVTYEGNPVFTFEPEVTGHLPVKPENLAAIQQAMRESVDNPRGTAIRTFRGFGIPVYGKTGTAQNPLGRPHSWFVAYTNSARGLSNIAIAVIAENAGEGSDVAAPIARRVIEFYFLGRPQRLYPWESSFFVTSTPTPRESPTPTSPPPTPTPTETPTPEPTPDPALEPTPEPEE
ncbi:MAG TPA: penicillin-binding transpeptidase domain-containing protein [Levilinea sp.]|nr:penicillin-binding transpeptidase domain-containing protein [Levilinea sp.]